MIRLTSKQLPLCVAILAYRSSLGGNIDHVAEMSDTYKKQEPYVAQSNTVMFASSHPEPRQSEKPRRRTFEDIRTENKIVRIVYIPVKMHCICHMMIAKVIGVIS